MGSNLQTVENPESQSTEEQNPLAKAASSPPFATLSFSRSILPTLFFQQPKVSSLSSPQPNKLRVPTQAFSLTHLSLSAFAPSPSKISFKSTISANPFQDPLTRRPQRPLDPSNAAGIRRASIVWFRSDLRLHDNDCLNSANNESMSVLPVYCFDPRDYGNSSSGKTGPSRATFVIESVADLRKNLKARGSDLVVRVGKPETVLVELAKEIGADAVYGHKEVSHDEVQSENKIEAAMKEEGVDVKYFWGSTLYHLDDLPFKLEDMPARFGGFREKVQGLEIRKPIAALDQLKGLPTRGDVEPGDIPSLTDLGFKPVATMSQDGKVAANGSMRGGESEAQQKLKKLAAECQAQPHKGTKNGIHGPSFSCKISPWLATGCISSRLVFDEIKKTASSTMSSALKLNGGGSGFSDTGSNWLMCQLLWRDFFRFVTKKYSSPKKQLDAAPASACTGALA